ncbi:hypothetical protein NDU88_001094 [Pleurodeles waltl]|uniref:Uncharacterized protein n=1 Tax=Pleurodeles waltl TaxID=8319 RepID=A0AAV7NEQ0_PLEWA|nr:hypothetical protein NDU88_001094 [Pleurodeles waltl]
MVKIRTQGALTCSMVSGRGQVRARPARTLRREPPAAIGGPDFRPRVLPAVPSRACNQAGEGSLAQARACKHAVITKL